MIVADIRMTRILTFSWSISNRIETYIAAKINAVKF